MKLTVIDHLKCLVYTLHHKALVARFAIPAGLIWEAFVHDFSKYTRREWRGWVETNKLRLAGLPPSDLARASWKLHAASNRHHPEFWGGRPMSRRALTEMLCDLRAAGIAKNGFDDTRQFFACFKDRLGMHRESLEHFSFMVDQLPPATGTVMVNGCYDVLHADHVEFFKKARALGRHLFVSVARDEVVTLCKGRDPAVNEGMRLQLVKELSCVKWARLSSDISAVLDCETALRIVRPEYFVATEDDRHSEYKKAICEETGTKYVQVKKGTRTSSTAIREAISKNS